MRKKKQFSMTTQYVLIVCALLLVANFALGSILISQSKKSMKTLINEHMIYISKTAASLIDGDTLEALTEDDIGSEDYESIYRVLTTFQKNMVSDQNVGDLKYIYTVRQVSEDKFIFIIDPDPDAPASFGDETVVTNAIHSAAKGESAIDFTRLEDEWGAFYTAYSPVFDSKGNVAGIIGADFDAAWYEDQLTKNGSALIIMALASLTVGALVVLVITTRMRKHFNKLNNELSALSGDVGELADELVPKLGLYASQSDAQASADTDTVVKQSNDPVEQIDKQVRQIRTRIGGYLEFMHQQAYMDLMTGVGNRSAYTERTKMIDKAIAEKKAVFALAVFDINALKETNDIYGHDCGDKLIIAAAKILKGSFAVDSLYRIGGDEFAAIAEGFDEVELENSMEAVEKAVKEFNESDDKLELPLSFSKGAAVFDTEKDADFRSVFIRADEAMYNDKNKYYEALGDRRYRPYVRPTEQPGRAPGTDSQGESK